MGVARLPKVALRPEGHIFPAWTLADSAFPILFFAMQVAEIYEIVLRLWRTMYIVMSTAQHRSVAESAMCE